MSGPYRSFLETVNPERLLDEIDELYRESKRLAVLASKKEEEYRSYVKEKFKVQVQPEEPDPC